MEINGKKNRDLTLYRKAPIYIKKIL